MSDYSDLIKKIHEKTISESVRRTYLSQIIETYPNIPVSIILDDLLIKNKDAFAIEEQVVSYKNYLKKQATGQIKTGYKTIDETIRGINPGEVLSFLARTAVGKTIFGLNVARNVNLSQKIPIVFFSLEQQIPQVFERLAAIHLQKSTEEVEKIFKSNFDAKASSKLIKDLDHIYVVDKNSLTFSQMTEYMAQIEKKIHKHVSLVIIDYLGYMQSKGQNIYEKTSNLAKELKAFAKNNDTAVVAIAQVNRSGLSGGEEITLSSFRDSGVLEESADYVIGAWRPELELNISETEEHMRAGQFKMKVLKNRSGKTGIEVSCDFDTTTLEIVEV